MSEAVTKWISSVGGSDWLWYVKILSGNDTLLNGSHQAGPYIPLPMVGALFPDLRDNNELNPRRSFDIAVDSHGTQVTGTLIWYNNKVVGDGTRNECRITNWGGKASPVLDPESTGSLCVFAFHRGAKGSADECRVWLCRNIDEEDQVSARVGPVEPGTGIVFSPSGTALSSVTRVERDRPCWIPADKIPPEWLLNFPDAATILDRAIANLPRSRHDPPDKRLLRRRDCEFEVFRSVEEAYVGPRIREGFATVDLFVSYANSVTNRRKARSGASLELHASRVFDEEGVQYSRGEVSEQYKRPDFLFPSAEHYRDPRWPADRLRMLAAKTTCKDRWRQVMDEAERIPQKHLLTLQEGTSIRQFEQMQAGGIVLVVPAGLHSSYPKRIRPHLLTLDAFIADTRAGFQS